MVQRFIYGKLNEWAQKWAHFIAFLRNDMEHMKHGKSCKECHMKKKPSKAKKHKKEGKVGKVMHEFKEGKLHSGSKKGPKVKSRKQAIAIGLSEARKQGAKIPKKKK